MTELEGRLVLVTGASRGLGAELALAFASAGAPVAICARTAEPLAAVAEAVRSAGGECLARTVDVVDEAEVAAWVQAASEAYGTPAVLVNNASVLTPRKPFIEQSVAEWRRTLEVNLTAAFIVSRCVLPAMLRGGAGSIINVSSGAALPPRANWGAYGVAKLALDGFTRNLAEELKESGVRVNSVDPGALRTRMRTVAYPHENPGSVKPPAAATAVFLWLASDASRNVTGERFRAEAWRGG